MNRVVRLMDGPLAGETMTLWNITTVRTFLPEPASMAVADEVSPVAPLPPILEYDIRRWYNGMGGYEWRGVLDGRSRVLWEQNQRALLDPYAPGRIGRYDGIRISDVVSPDAMSVRFSAMSEEAEAEMAAWDDVLHGHA